MSRNYENRENKIFLQQRRCHLHSERSHVCQQKVHIIDYFKQNINIHVKICSGPYKYAHINSDINYDDINADNKYYPSPMRR